MDGAKSSLLAGMAIRLVPDKMQGEAGANYSKALAQGVFQRKLIKEENNMKKFRGVIFDLDGTLLDTLDDLADAMNSVLQKHGFPIHAVASYKLFIGHGLRNLVKNALPDTNRDDTTIDKCLEEMKKTYSQHWANKTHIYEGIGELLDELSRMNIKLGVLSNKADNFTKLMVKHFLGKWHFEAVYGEREGMPRKPDPQGAIEISNIMRINPNEIIYVGDSGSDMLTAANAGMFGVGVLWGFRDKQELIENGAKATISHPLEIIALMLK